MKKLLTLLAFFFGFTFTSLASQVETNSIPSSKQNTVITQVETHNDENQSFVYCGGGYIYNNSGDIIGDWFYCDAPNGNGTAVFRITFYLAEQ
ncbi:MAG: hypothetical protein ACK4R6_02325 [Spirosomataceae bacterium]